MATVLSTILTTQLSAYLGNMNGITGNICETIISFSSSEIIKLLSALVTASLECLKTLTNFVLLSVILVRKKSCNNPALATFLLSKCNNFDNLYEKYKEEAAKFAIYINEKMGVASYETGSGFSGWTTKADESKLNPLFIQIKDLLAEGKQGVLAWDTSLEAEPAAVHNEQVQTLFADGADVKAFIEEHKAAINGK